MAVFTTEIASDKIVSDNPIHQRLLKPYYEMKSRVKGDLLDVGCGEGRGVDFLIDQVDSYLGLDKIQEVIDNLNAKFEIDKAKFEQAVFPPFKHLKDNSYDCVISFQVIEHVKADKDFLKEIYRVLKPGGKAYITTPNIIKTLSRNPWHIREYTAKQLTDLAKEVFDQVEMLGVTGNEKVWDYYEANKKSVNKIMRFDIFDLQYKLPAPILRIPYEILNRMNRNKLQEQTGALVSDISHEDFWLTEKAEEGIDLFGVFTKL